MQLRQVAAIPAGMGVLSAVCVDRQDRLFVAGDSLRVFSRDGRVEAEKKLSRPGFAVAVRPSDGAICVGEVGQVEIFGGLQSRIWRDPAWLGAITAIGFFRQSVLVADVKDRCIRRYDSKGQPIAEIGKENRTRGFLVPNGVLDFRVDPNGVIHAANPGKHRIERYTLDGELLGSVGRFDGVSPAGFSGCCNPTNLAMDAAGRYYTAEKADPRAKMLSSDGALLGVIATTVFDPGCKNMSIAVDSRRRVYVADTVRRQILVFEPEVA